MKLLRYPLKQLAVRVVCAAIALGLLTILVGWGRARDDRGEYDATWSTKEQMESEWIPPWEPW